jgi:hypothetical protein
MTMKSWLASHDFWAGTGKEYRLLEVLPEHEVEVYIRRDDA